MYVHIDAPTVGSYEHCLFVLSGNVGFFGDFNGLSNLSPR